MKRLLILFIFLVTSALSADMPYDTGADIVSTLAAGGTLSGPLAWNVCTQTADDTTPAMGTIPGGCNVLETSTANTGSGTGDITTLDGPILPGMILYIVGAGGTNVTNIADGGNFNLETAWAGAVDRVLVLYVQAVDDFVEVGRHNGIRYFDDLVYLESLEYITNSADGVIAMGGAGGSNNEDIAFDLETTSNEVGIGTNTGVTVWDWGTIQGIFGSAEINGTITLQNDETITNATDGKITLTGVGGSNNEDLIIDLETTADEINFSSSTGATVAEFTSMQLQSVGLETTGAVNFNGVAVDITTTGAEDLTIDAGGELVIQDVTNINDIIIQTATLSAASGDENAIESNWTCNKVAGNCTGHYMSMTDTSSPGAMYSFSYGIGASPRIRHDMDAGELYMYSGRSLTPQCLKTGNDRDIGLNATNDRNNAVVLLQDNVQNNFIVGNADDKVLYQNFTSNGTAVITKASHTVDTYQAVGSLVVLVDATTSADEGHYLITAIDANTITLDRALSGSDADVDIMCYHNVIGMFMSDGAAGNYIGNFNAANKPLQISGVPYTATSNGLSVWDLIIGAKLEVDGISYFDDQVKIQAGQSNNEETFTSDDTLDDNNSVVYINAASNDVTLTLPAAPLEQVFHVKRIDGSTWIATVAGDGENIDGAATQTLSEYDAITIHGSADNNEWYIH